MTGSDRPLTSFFAGWDNHNRLLTAAIASLTPEQLALRATPEHWSVGTLATHIVGVRAYWFQEWMGVGGVDVVVPDEWDESVVAVRRADELVAGLDTTFRMMWNALAGWTSANLDEVFSDPRGRTDSEGRVRAHSRQRIIWHVAEHDVHHGGEISLILGMHGLKALGLWSKHMDTGHHATTPRLPAS